MNQHWNIVLFLCLYTHCDGKHLLNQKNRSNNKKVATIVMRAAVHTDIARNFHLGAKIMHLYVSHNL